MARVAAFVPDLLFGSKVIEMLRAAGHEPVLVSDLARLEPDTADVLVVDLTVDATERVKQIEGTRTDGLRTLAFYAHTEADVRALAEQAGFDLVVPRSRMAREGPQLIERLTS